MMSKQKVMSTTVYLDAAASALKSKSVINAEVDFLKYHYANAGRGVCMRAELVDKMVNDARTSVAKFINADLESIIFTSGTTDGLNRVCRILEKSSALNPASVVMVSDLDHHSARMPWQEFAKQGKCKIKICPLDNGNNLYPYDTKDKIDVFVITAMSNVLGAGQNVKKLIKWAKGINPKVITIVDAAQYVAHLPIDVATVSYTHLAIGICI